MSELFKRIKFYEDEWGCTPNLFRITVPETIVLEFKVTMVIVIRKECNVWNNWVSFGLMKIY